MTDPSPETIDGEAPAEVQRALAEENALIQAAVHRHLEQRVVDLNIARHQLAAQLAAQSARVDELAAQVATALADHPTDPEAR